MPVSRKEFVKWAAENFPPLPTYLTKTDRIIDTIRAYAELAAGWDPAKEDDYKDFYAAIYAIAEEKEGCLIPNLSRKPSKT